MKKLVLSLLLIITIVCSLYAQDTLPKFSVKNAGNNRIVVSWVNRFTNIRQISIQRSFDSVANYKTILTVPDPTTPENGYVDTKATNDKMFYRLYILLDKGVYLFSVAKRPVIDSLRKTDFVKTNDLLDKISNNKDSVTAPNISINMAAKPDVFVPSIHVYTYKDGYVRINLPDDEDKKYSLKFFEDDDSFLFELKDIKERTFRIDKANFYHAGWFKFELYENGKLIEKYKFYLQKDF
jgi:hypothetical protein